MLKSSLLPDQRDYSYLKMYNACMLITFLLQAQKLEDEIEPLLSTNRDLNVLRESLQAEKLAPQKEADSWRNRTNKLIE